MQVSAPLDVTTELVQTISLQTVALTECEDSFHLMIDGNYGTLRSLYRKAPNWFKTPFALQDTEILHSTWRYTELKALS